MLAQKKKVVSYSDAEELPGITTAVKRDPSPLDLYQKALTEYSPPGNGLAAQAVQQWATLFWNSLITYFQGISKAPHEPDLSKGFFAKFLQHSPGDPAPTLAEFDNALKGTTLNQKEFEKFCTTREKAPKGKSKGKGKKKTAQPAQLTNRKHALAFAHIVLARFHIISATAQPDEVATLSTTVYKVLTGIGDTFFGNHPEIKHHIGQSAAFFKYLPTVHLYQELLNYIEPEQSPPCPTTHPIAPNTKFLTANLGRFFPGVPGRGSLDETINYIVEHVLAQQKLLELEQRAYDTEVGLHIQKMADENPTQVIAFATQLLRYCKATKDASLNQLVCTLVVVHYATKSNPNDFQALVYLLYSRLVERILFQEAETFDQLPSISRAMSAIGFALPKQDKAQAFKAIADVNDAKRGGASKRTLREMMRAELETPLRKPTNLHECLEELKRYMMFLYRTINEGLNSEREKGKKGAWMEEILAVRSPRYLKGVQRHWERAQSDAEDRDLNWTKTVDVVCGLIALILAYESTHGNPNDYYDLLKWIHRTPKDLHGSAMADVHVLFTLNQVVQNNEEIKKALPELILPTMGEIDMALRRPDLPDYMRDQLRMFKDSVAPRSRRRR